MVHNGPVRSYIVHFAEKKCVPPDLSMWAPAGPRPPPPRLHSQWCEVWSSTLCTSFCAVTRIILGTQTISVTVTHAHHTNRGSKASSNLSYNLYRYT